MRDSRSESSWKEYLGAVSVSIVTVLPISLTGALTVQISNDLDVPVSAIGLAPAAFFGTGAIVSPFVGSVVRRFGSSNTMKASTAVVACLLILVGSHVDTLPELFLLLALGGAANALGQPAVNLYLAQRIAHGRHGKAFGIKQSAVPSAGMLAGLAVPFIALTVGWRWAFIALSVLSPLIIWGLPSHETYMKLPILRRCKASRHGKALFAIALGGGLAASGAGCLSIFMVPGAVEAGWSEAGGGLIFAAASAVGIVARFSSGVRADYRRGRHIQVIVLMLIVGSVGFFFLAFEQKFLYLIGAVLSFGFGWGWPGLLILSVVRLNPSDSASATAVLQTGTSVGLVAGPFVFGLLLQHYSYSLAWVAGGLSLILSSIVLWLVTLWEE